MDCSTCRAVTPHFANILREGEFKNVRFMLVSIDTDELSLFDYLVRNRYDGLYTPYILNGASETLSGLGFTGAIPHIAFIDSKGRVAKQLTGSATRDEVLSSISVTIQ